MANGGALRRGSRSGGCGVNSDAPRSLLRDSAYLRTLVEAWRYKWLQHLDIRLNPRLTSTVARLLANDRVIELSSSAAQLKSRSRREVICHEAAHFVVWRRYGGAARPHGPEWAALVQHAGFEPKASRVRCGQQRPRPTTKRAFLHTCPVCHFSKRAGRQMTWWRCPECRSIGLDGSLRVESAVR